MEEWRTRGSQIPAFGNWEYVNELPITQYFECARQAGLIRYSSSSGECDHPSNYNNNNNSASCDSVLKPRTASHPKQAKGNNTEKRGSSGGSTQHHVREGSRKLAAAGKVYDVTVTELPKAQVAKRHPAAATAVKKKQQQFQYDAAFAAQPRRLPKAVDEDLYQIPPELLKRKRRLGFFSRCLVPPCAV